MEDWKEIIDWHLLNPIRTKMAEFREKGTVYPDSKSVLKPFKLTRVKDVKVVIIGDEPYCDGTADGLSFSSQGKETPPDLQNIFKEISEDFGVNMSGYSMKEYFPTNDLKCWADRGILLLNAVMSVSEGQPGSHYGIGWEEFVKSVLTALNNGKQPIAFLLWGQKARQFAPLISNSIHFVQQASHPRPKTVKEGFIGAQHFAKTTSFLSRAGRMNTIDLWPYFDHDRVKRKINEVQKKLNYTQKWSDELIYDLMAGRFFISLDESAQIFSTNPEINFDL